MGKRQCVAKCYESSSLYISIFYFKSTYATADIHAFTAKRGTSELTFCNEHTHMHTGGTVRVPRLAAMAACPPGDAHLQPARACTARTAFGIQAGGRSEPGGYGCPDVVLGCKPSDGRALCTLSMACPGGVCMCLCMCVCMHMCVYVRRCGVGVGVGLGVNVCTCGIRWLWVGGGNKWNVLLQ